MGDGDSVIAVQGRSILLRAVLMSLTLSLLAKQPCLFNPDITNKAIS